jgi:hypothetical protein
MNLLSLASISISKHKDSFMNYAIQEVVIPGFRNIHRYSTASFVISS